MSEERSSFPYCPARTYEEAVYRLNPRIAYLKDEELRLRRLVGLKNVLIEQPPDLTGTPIDSRVYWLTEENLKFMERWSFRRSYSGSHEVAWNNDPFFPKTRTDYFKDIFPASMLRRKLQIWRLLPSASEGSTYSLVCIRTDHGFEDTFVPEWFVALLSRDEYRLLVWGGGLLATRPNS